MHLVELVRRHYGHSAGLDLGLKAGGYFKRTLRGTETTDANVAKPARATTFCGAAGAPATVLATSMYCSCSGPDGVAAR
jgi:hypothetical protein